VLQLGDDRVDRVRVVLDALHHARSERLIARGVDDAVLDRA
jgi:hypothetical protein